MLPMFYAPVAGEVVPRDWAGQAPRPDENTLGVWPQARRLALEFWQCAAADARISAAFRAIAQANKDLVETL
jgi:hypothetical protein